MTHDNTPNPPTPAASVTTKGVEWKPTNVDPNKGQRAYIGKIELCAYEWADLYWASAFGDQVYPDNDASKNWPSMDAAKAACEKRAREIALAILAQTSDAGAGGGADGGGKWTAGEWIVEPGDNGDASVGLSGYAPFIYSDVMIAGETYSVQICSLNEPIYRIEPSLRGEEFDEGIRPCGNISANGHLMKASPKLYESLQEIVAEWGYPNTPKWHRARSALALARGEVQK